MIAFEGLAVTTIAPLVATDLREVSLYAWIFSSFLLAQIVGTVAAGQVVDRRGAGMPFLVSLALLGGGLLVGGAAPNMVFLIGGRVLQGLGAGGLAASVYALINTCYPDRLRPRMLASISSAWVVPALIGPTVAGVVAERVSWRAVFFGLVPILFVVVSLSWRALRLLPAPSSEGHSRGPSRLPAAVVLSLATAIVLALLKGSLGVFSGALVVAGLVLVAGALHRLLPEGTMLARRGLPAAIATRGLFVGGFFCVDSFLVLALTARGGYSATVAGLVISAGALTWTAGSWVHERLDARDTRGRRARVLLGVALIATGIGVLLVTLAVASRPTVWITLVGWGIAGLGIGLAHSSSTTITFSLAPRGQEGDVSASLQLADFFMPGIVVGLGGALVELARPSQGGLQLGLLAAFSFAFLLVGLALLAAFHLPLQREAHA
jgi:MFS family permease